MDVMADLLLLPGLLRATAGLGILEGFFLPGTLMDLCELSALADPTARTPSPAVKWEDSPALLHHKSWEPWLIHT